jgi:nicotinate-nucleotide adenylyltransferase
MRTLCFGGTFNPIHHGHLACARAVAESAGFDRVVLIPNQLSPHKAEFADHAPAADRLAMCRLAVDGDPLFSVDDVELTRPSPSYTLETARALKSRGWNVVHWLIGADQVRSLPQWHGGTALLAEVQFVVMARPGWSLGWETMPESVRNLERAVVVDPLLQISGTDLRQRVRAGRSIRYLVPDAVAEYIRQKGLYVDGAARSSLP